MTIFSPTPGAFFSGVLCFFSPTICLPILMWNSGALNVPCDWLNIKGWCDIWMVS